MSLGIPTYNPTLDREAMSFQRDLLGQLGQQIQRDVTTVITKNQLAGLAQGLQNVDPASPSFGRDLTSVLTQYPLAAQTPIAAAAINQLGAEYKFNQQQKQIETAFGRQIGLMAGRDYIENRPYGAPPVSRSALESVVTGEGVPVPQPSIPSAGTEPELPTGGGSVSGLDELMATDAALKQSGLPRPVAEAALRSTASKVGDVPQPRANITGADGLVWTQFSDGSVAPAADPAGNQLRAPQRTTQTVDRDRASLYTTRNKLLQDYAKVRAEAEGLQAAWATFNAAGNPQAGDAGVKQKDKAAQAAMLKQALDEVNAALGIGGAAETPPPVATPAPPAATSRVFDWDPTKKLIPVQ